MIDPTESALLAAHFTPAVLAAARAAGRDPWIARNAVYVRCTACAHWADACTRGHSVTTPDALGLCNAYQPPEETP